MTMKKTKIVATIGPASESEAMLTCLVKAGMNVCRLNFSHGAHEEHFEKVKNIRKVAEKLGTPTAILQDLSGPKIRIGDFYQERVMLKKGGLFTLTTKACVGDETKAFVSYSALPKEIMKGDSILLDDGKKRLEILEVKGDEIKCRIIVGGETKGRRGVNIPGVSLKISCLTAKDKKDVLFGIEHKVDYVALSFVRRASDIRELRAILTKAKSTAKIISKIETEEAIQNIDAIIAETDGVMVARGDLAVEVPAQEVPILQKMIIEKCNIAGKPVIVATQMMESMIKSPVPTRAEVSDVANSILDGADAVMLSEESALGEYPVETVQMMSNVAEIAEKNYPHSKALYGDALLGVGDRRAHRKDVVDAVTFSVVSTASAVGAKVIIALSESGLTARMVSRYRPEQPVIAMSPKDYVVRQLELVFGCFPARIEHFTNVSDVMKVVRAYVLKKKLAKKGDKVVVAAGIPFGHVGGTNTIMVEVI
ncbi:MAG: pyruvate kinase [Candidatus Yonathbacteria bacterium CG10_big_fil_rev_8_21_14_0_10_43_136]|uniref:Pyruvate kinase n=1 Tax=Candidatus Yonathbacteria bacterium CG_4_10_14_0_8_um_filter_43_17 TaxID=1975099 RepID=A0A2M7Q5A1_9BACT|nr:MAG: pyruvate kinase [Candidatus Yonathbacteria bacterium CG17_big_fil_post_rev_8_21_14_2_50_43_9]PIR40964.1 MAG: pyruvate kinase [Candidatus Yonathbacteria bacterium CG10_big_fil_rev_8_21_14_0_10_43_136]PIX57417.1 MAG: pyruvate kinase [Candidatus Yonathbacteria bacterium CG_4_10_14_3_um_filter_43_12]PIY58240.1 MAG: pyruvate kinase [Candidatus Yonathbacteria bacterium CG_4_10_14_0_8_um_filter_43_17]PJC21835.1 MAG: pyruvate kinase [Candidatus Yonathbacteria bacterium CG_4_9_14_0_2_um_filter_4